MLMEIRTCGGVVVDHIVGPVLSGRPRGPFTVKIPPLALTHYPFPYFMLKCSNRHTVLWVRLSGGLLSSHPHAGDRGGLQRETHILPSA
jgi:hypothetical protein